MQKAAEGRLFPRYAAAILVFGFSLEEPKIHGLTFWAISFCAVLAVLVSLLKLRNLWRELACFCQLTNSSRGPKMASKRRKGCLWLGLGRNARSRETSPMS